MKFNRILEQYVKENESLTKVRLKVDPKDSIGIDFRNFDGYEGYIIKEGKYFSILFEGVDLPIMQIPFSVIKVIKIGDTDIFKKVKVAAIEKINRIKEITPEFLNKISACTSVDFLEQYLKEEGLSESDIKTIYKNNMFSEDLDTDEIISKAKTVAKTVAKYALAPDLGFRDLTRALYGPKRQKREDNTQENRIKQIFRNCQQVVIPITQNDSITKNIKSFLDNFTVFNTQYFTYNSITQDIFEPEFSNNRITKITICNKKISDPTVLSKQKARSFFETEAGNPSSRRFFDRSFFELFI
jgi:hypothetical protein